VTPLVARLWAIDVSTSSLAPPGIGMVGACGPRIGKGAEQVLLEDYGLIGDLQAAALVGRNGAIT
jgi:hypothetical protein